MCVRNSQFDHIADEYDTSLAPHVRDHYLRKRVAFITSERDHAGSALDVGCGTGMLAQALSRAGWNVAGIDSSAGMLKVMQRRCERATQASALALPFPADAFEIVYSVAALHHIAEPHAIRQTIHEMSRVCKPGGAVIVWDHNARNPYWPFIMRRVPQDTGLERIPSIAELIAAFNDLPETEIRDIRYLGFVPDFAPRFLLPMFRWMERVVESSPNPARWLAAHNVIVARKTLHRVRP